MWPVTSGWGRGPLSRSLGWLGGRERTEMQGVCRAEQRPWENPLSTWGICAEHTHVCGLGGGWCAWLHTGVCIPGRGTCASACQQPCPFDPLQTLPQLGRDIAWFRRQCREGFLKVKPSSSTASMNLPNTFFCRDFRVPSTAWRPAAVVCIRKDRARGRDSRESGRGQQGEGLRGGRSWASPPGLPGGRGN